MERDDGMDDDAKTKAELQALKARFRKIEDLESECRECSLRMAEAAEESKEAKKAYEAAVSRLRSAVRDATSGQQELPFAEEPELWRAVTLAELEISGKLAESLTEAKLDTLGAIADYTAAGNLLTDLKGVGEKAAAKIEAATADWWERHPEMRPDEKASEGDGEAGQVTSEAVES